MSANDALAKNTHEGDAAGIEAHRPYLMRYALLQLRDGTDRKSVV